MVTKWVPREKNMDMKSVQVNPSQRVTRMTKRDVKIQTGYIGRGCLAALST